MRQPRILLGVGGGVAAYKAVELASRLRQSGHRVRAVLSPGAERFVTALGVASVARGPAYTDGDWDRASGRVLHVDLARWAQGLVVAPATADLMAAMAQGRADSLLLATWLSFRGRKLLAPAMESAMWEAAPTQANLAALAAAGVAVLGPLSGHLASGQRGPGRMVEPAELEDAVAGLVHPVDLAGVRALVTAGPTWEPLDPVRHLTNPSSGRMGVALAAALRDRGARVTLILGPSALADPPGVETLRVRTAREMMARFEAAFPDARLVVGAAAVGDFRPARCHGEKLDKAAVPVIELTLNPDLMAWAGEHRDGRVLVGFAATTGDSAASAQAKLARKGLQLVVGNDVAEPGSGFGSPTNRVLLAWEDGTVERLPPDTKIRVAHRILDGLRDRGLV